MTQPGVNDCQRLKRAWPVNTAATVVKSFSRCMPADSAGYSSGTAGFGLRRMLIDQSGERKAMLKIGEQKASRPTALFWCAAG